MRTSRELAFRLKQELANARLWLTQPTVGSGVTHTPLDLPAPADAVAYARTAPFGADIVRKADELLSHRFEFLGERFDARDEISWRRDYRNGLTSGLRYFRFIPYLDASKVGDHKFVWELNRHQHLVLLAQAQLMTRDRKYLGEIERQLDSWTLQNRFMCGINWCSALEVAFRALSWIWVHHLVGDQLNAGVRQRLVNEIYRSGLYLEHNLSVYFSPNTHLLGEAVALHAIGRLFPSLPASERWRTDGAAMVSREMERQVRDDGTHFEQSSYYHVYALDMFMFHHLLADASPEYVNKLRAMAVYLDALMGKQRTLPLIGDDDGGRFFHPYGKVDEFGRATLATCAIVLRQDWPYGVSDVEQQALWWLGREALDPPNRRAPLLRKPAASRVFRDAGIVILQSGSVHGVFDCGPFGRGSGGHSHADSLELVIRSDGEDVLVDPGTYTYVGSERERNWFRGSGAHSTVRVDDRDQAAAAGPFRWNDKPHVELSVVSLGDVADVVTGRCEYRADGISGLVHRRSVLFAKSPSTFPLQMLVVCDVISGLAGVHRLEQLWHLASAPVLVKPNHGSIKSVTQLLVTDDAALDVIPAFRSPAFGEKIPSTILTSRQETALPATMWAIVIFGDASDVSFRRGGDREAVLTIEKTTITFSEDERGGISY